jgi:hypothetical protein
MMFADEGANIHINYFTDIWICLIYPILLIIQIIPQSLVQDMLLSR